MHAAAQASVYDLYDMISLCADEVGGEAGNPGDPQVRVLACAEALPFIVLYTCSMLAGVCSVSRQQTALRTFHFSMYAGAHAQP